MNERKDNRKLLSADDAYFVNDLSMICDDDIMRKNCKLIN